MAIASQANSFAREQPNPFAKTKAMGSGHTASLPSAAAAPVWRRQRFRTRRRDWRSSRGARARGRARGGSGRTSRVRPGNPTELLSKGGGERDGAMSVRLRVWVSGAKGEQRIVRVRERDGKNGTRRTERGGGQSHRAVGIGVRTRRTANRVGFSSVQARLRAVRFERSKGVRVRETRSSATQTHAQRRFGRGVRAAGLGIVSSVGRRAAARSRGATMKDERASTDS